MSKFIITKNGEEEIKTYEKKGWSAVAIDLDNGSAYVEFFKNSGEKFAEIYVDDYEYGRSRAWKSLDSDIDELPETYEEAYEELEHWENGRGECASPLDKEYWS